MGGEVVGAERVGVVEERETVPLRRTMSIAVYRALSRSMPAAIADTRPG